MNAAWVVYVLLVGAILAVAANMLEAAARRIRISTRWVWVAALTGLVALSVSAPLRTPPVAPPVEQVAPLVTTSSPADATPSTFSVQRFRSELASLEGRAAQAVAGMIPVTVVPTFVVVWLVASGFVALLIVVINVVMLRRRAHWPLAELHGATVRITPDVGPAVIGFAAPEIVVPGWLLQRTDDEQRLAVAHEREHLAARDHVLLAGGWIAAALLPWHPAVWWMLARLRLAIELDCDARVLSRGVAPRPYGQLLIDIADHASGQRATALALADRTSHLERRLLAMKNSRTRLGRTRAALLGVTGMLAILVACEAKMPTSAEIENANVATLEKQALDAKVVAERAGMKTAYVVDGKPVTATEAHAIKANEIATVNITKGDAGNKVLIATRKAPANEAEIVQGRRLAEVGSLKVRSTEPFNGIILIDGVRATESDLVKIKLSPDRIQSVEVMKGNAAVQAFPDSAAANGVISIRTKQP